MTTMTPSEAETPRRPLPELTDWNRPYFEAGLNGEFKLQRCRNCGRYIYYPRPICNECGCMDLDWEVVSGNATLYSFTKVWSPEHPYFRPEIPILMGTVELQEGPRMFSRIAGDPNQELEIGMALEVAFEVIATGIAIPVFRAKSA